MHNHWWCLFVEVALIRLLVRFLGVEREALDADFEEYFNRMVDSGYVHENQKISVYNYVESHLKTKRNADLSVGQ